MEQLTIHLVESCTKGQDPQQKSSSLLMAKRCSGGDCVPHSGSAKWRIPRRRYFSTVPRRKNTGLVQLNSTVLALPPRPNQLLCVHTRTTPAALKRSAPNGVCHVVGEFMTYSCLRQKLKNDHSYCTSGRWRNGCVATRNLWLSSAYITIQIKFNIDQPNVASQTYYVPNVV